jgi:polysaccharide export outer membrane protein
MSIRLEAKILALCVVSIALLAAGCARPGAPHPPEEVAGLREPYVIGIPDMLQISVWKNPELSVQVPVRSDGKISVPLIDDIQAEGMTPIELKEVISEKLSEYITAPDVTVIVMNPYSQSVTVVGGVIRSGSIPLNRETRVLEAVAAVGGFNTWAKRSDVRVLRPTPDGLVDYRFNYGAFLAGKAPDSNIILEPGDTVVVPD